VIRRVAYRTAPAEGWRRRAFTLVETIAAVVVLAIGLPPMLWAIRDAHVQRVNPVLASRARWLAEAKMEDLIADRSSETRGYDYLIAGNYPAEGSISGYPGFTRSVSLSETEADLATAGTGYMKITVTVGWTDAAGDARSLQVSTVLTEYTP
jgi:prepilin-type N-terminal cleavage/methylation domain-containing protein